MRSSIPRTFLPRQSRRKGRTSEFSYGLPNCNHLDLLRRRAKWLLLVNSSRPLVPENKSSECRLCAANSPSIYASFFAPGPTPALEHVRDIDSGDVNAFPNWEVRPATSLDPDKILTPVRCPSPSDSRSRISHRSSKPSDCCLRSEALQPSSAAWRDECSSTSL